MPDQLHGSGRSAGIVICSSSRKGEQANESPVRSYFIGTSPLFSIQERLKCGGSHGVKVQTAAKRPRRLFATIEFVGFSSLSFSRRFRQSALRRSIIETSLSTLVIQQRMKLRLPRREQADSGRNVRHALEQNPGFWPWGLRRFSRARFKTFGQN